MTHFRHCESSRVSQSVEIYDACIKIRDGNACIKIGNALFKIGNACIMVCDASTKIYNACYLSFSNLVELPESMYGDR